jgi:histidinol-phosphate/aromatic aminotransferase/cobyric acid decarboxylase-like protein
MDTKNLGLRPAWDEDQYHHDYKIDLSTNVCFDAANPIWEFDLNSYVDTSRCYNILADYHSVNTRQIAIGLGLSELIMRIGLIIKERGLSMTSHHNSWKPIHMIQKLYNIPHGDDVCYVSNPHGTNGTRLESYDKLLDKHKLVIVDEAYGDFCDMPERKLGSSKLLILKTLSKSIALPGARFGWAIGHEPIINEIQNLRPAQVCIGGMTRNLVSILDEIPHHVKRMNQTKAYIEKNYNCIESHSNYVLIKNYEKFIRHYHLKEFDDHARMSLINRSMVTKSALDKEHAFFSRT